MRSNNGNGSRAAWARGFIGLGAVLGLGLSARPAAAAPFAYVVTDAIIFLATANLGMTTVAR